MGTVHRILKQPFFGRYQKPWLWPPEIAADGWETVRFPSANGAGLVGVFGGAYTEPARGALVLAHPLGAAAKGFWLKYGHADLFRSAGFHVLPDGSIFDW